jgi:hypothetical protein
VDAHHDGKVVAETLLFVLEQVVEGVNGGAAVDGVGEDLGETLHVAETEVDALAGKGVDSVGGIAGMRKRRFKLFSRPISGYGAYPIKTAPCVTYWGACPNPSGNAPLDFSTTLLTHGGTCLVLPNAPDNKDSSDFRTLSTT